MKILFFFILSALIVCVVNADNFDPYYQPHCKKVKEAMVLVSDGGEILIGYKGHLYRVVSTNHHEFCSCYDGYIPYENENPLKIDYYDR